MTGLLKSVAVGLLKKGIVLPERSFERLYELKHLKQLLSALNINCVIDVGANRGGFVDDVRTVGYRGRVISFEPLQKEFEYIAHRFSSDSNWQGHQMALGSEKKTMKIHVYEKTVYSSFLESSNAEKEVGYQEVQLNRLDDLFPSLVHGIETPKVFLKMDTQGFDLEVFKGASGCLNYIHGLQSEISIQPVYKGMPHYLEALEVYESAGFELFNFSTVSRLENGGLIELNCFMKRK